jgi:biopolymer transport protein ExbD
MFWIGLSNHKIFLSNKEISIAELENKAKSFIGGVKNDYYFRVTGGSDVSSEEFETVTDVLKKLNIPESKILCIVDDKPGN